MTDSTETINLQNAMEQIVQKQNYEHYDVWLKNFSLNLENIWNEPSGKILQPNENEKRTPDLETAIVIGRGPSLKKNNHLELLANSNFKGTIVCCDGILIEALKAGVTPEKFPNFYVVTIDYAPTYTKFYDDEIVDKFGKKIKGIFTTISDPKVVTRARDAGIKIHWVHPLFDLTEGKKSFNYITSKITKARKEDEGLPAIQTGGNVGTSAWFVSWMILKCKTVCLVGINHGWEEDDPWEKIITHNGDLLIDIDQNDPAFKKLFQKVYNPDFDNYCIFDPMFLLYSLCFREFISRSPTWVNTINCTEGGSIFGDRITSKYFNQFLNSFSSN
tara:strand:+ start:11716 stop:12708 length:993 start_codon:yes stop_codon:yes gene_type:complete